MGSWGNQTTVTGNITYGPELRFTPGGAAVTNFGIAWNTKDRDGDDVAHFFDVTCWNDLAEHVAESLDVGDRVMVEGRLDFREWETDDGDQRSKIGIQADEVGVALKWAIVPDIQKPEREDRQKSSGRKSGGKGKGRGKSSGSNRGQGRSRSEPKYDPNEEPF